DRVDMELVDRIVRQTSHPQSSSSRIRGALGSGGLALLYALATRTMFTTPAANPNTRPTTNPHGEVWIKKSTPYPSNAPTRMAAPNSPPNLNAREAALSGGWDVEEVSPRAFATRLRRSSRRSSGGFLFAIERSNARPRGGPGPGPPFARAETRGRVRPGQANQPATNAANSGIWNAPAEESAPSAPGSVRLRHGGEVQRPLALGQSPRLFRPAPPLVAVAARR